MIHFVDMRSIIIPRMRNKLQMYILQVDRIPEILEGNKTHAVSHAVSQKCDYSTFVHSW